MIHGPMHSAVRAEDWLPVQDEMLQGLVHSCNNRVAALSGLMQLQEHGLAEPQEGIVAVTEEVKRLRTLLDLFRAICGRRGEQREARRLEDALQTAMSVLAHHHGARRWDLRMSESVQAEPVLLWPSDALRLPVLLLLAAGAGTPEGGIVEAAVTSVGAESVVTVTGGGSEPGVRARPEFAALQHAVTAEGGSLGCAPGMTEASVTVTLALPVLGSTSA